MLKRVISFKDKKENIFLLTSCKPSCTKNTSKPIVLKVSLFTPDWGRACYTLTGHSEEANIRGRSVQLFTVHETKYAL